MKLTAHEEYGLRCLLQIGKQGEGGSLTIPQLSRLEGISEAYAAKLLRILRLAGYVKSTRGPIGGYTLAKPPEKITVGEVLSLFGGKLIEEDFCQTHSGLYEVCKHTTACTLRPLWDALQKAIDQVLYRITLKDLLEADPDFRGGSSPAHSGQALVQLAASQQPASGGQASEARKP